MALYLSHDKMVKDVGRNGHGETCGRSNHGLIDSCCQGTHGNIGSQVFPGHEGPDKTYNGSKKSEHRFHTDDDEQSTEVLFQVLNLLLPFPLHHRLNLLSFQVSIENS